jgi:hypothetical protein
MRHLLISASLVVAIFSGCSESDDLNTRLSESQQNEESAAVIGEALALESGGALEAIEFSIDHDVDDGSYEGAPLADYSKALETDDALFDSSSCVWTLTWHREFEGPFAGFEWDVERTVHLMDFNGDCIVRPQGDGSLNAIDLTRQFNGSSYNRRHSGGKSGQGDWAIRELNDDIMGALVNGSHHREGAGEVYRWTEDGQVTVEHEFTLDLEGVDLRIIRHMGRRIPIDGSIHVVYHAVRGDVVIDRDVWIYFGDDGGRMEFENGESYEFDPVSGEIS